MDHCTAAFPSEDVAGANKQPVIQGMIITHFMSANCRMSPFCYPQMLIATKGVIIAMPFGELSRVVAVMTIEYFVSVLLRVCNTSLLSGPTASQAFMESILCI